MQNRTRGPTAKWTANDYLDKNGKPKKLINWTHPPLIYPCDSTEKQALSHLRDTFSPVPPYKDTSVYQQGMQSLAERDNTLVTVPIDLPAGYYAFLENTAEKCTSPQTKHSREGMQGARHWVQRVDTADGIFRRLTDGYGISLMFGERFHQFIRNGKNWRGSFGVMADIDVWRDPVKPGTVENDIEKMHFDGVDIAQIIDKTGHEKKGHTRDY